MEDKIEETAYLVLMIDCAICYEALDSFAEDSPVDPMDVWAKRFAKRARDLGWQTDDRNRILCPRCALGTRQA